MTPQQIYRWLADLVASLPEGRVTLTWGSPHFRVGDKIFGGWGAHKDGRYALSAKLDKEKQAALVASDPRFQVAAYVGKHGWVSFSPGDAPELGELEALLLESYRLIAPKALVAKLADEHPARAAKAGAGAKSSRAPRSSSSGAAAHQAAAKPKPKATPKAKPTPATRAKVKAAATPKPKPRQAR